MADAPSVHLRFATRPSVPPSLRNPRWRPWGRAASTTPRLEPRSYFVSKRSPIGSFCFRSMPSCRWSLPQLLAWLEKICGTLFCICPGQNVFQCLVRVGDAPWRERTQNRGARLLRFFSQSDGSWDLRVDPWRSTLVSRAFVTHGS